METKDIEKLLDELRAEVHAEMTKLDQAVIDYKSATRVAEYQVEKARNVALEALSEIRNIRGTLTTAASTKPSPETRPATGRSRSRGRRV